MAKNGLPRMIRISPCQAQQNPPDTQNFQPSLTYSLLSLLDKYVIYQQLVGKRWKA